MRYFALTSYMQYFLSGLVITTIGSVMPQLLAHYGLSYTEGGRLVFLGSVGFMIGVPLSSYLMGRMKGCNPIWPNWKGIRLLFPPIVRK